MEDSSVLTDGAAGVSTRRVALFVDGENISPALAGRILALAGSRGTLVMRCVFGDMTSPAMKAWEAAPSYRAIHSFQEKDSADIRLTIEAMEAAYTGRTDAFVLASSDTGLAHLVHHLAELGFPVFGIVEKKATARLRKSFLVYDVVAKPDGAEAEIAKSTPAKPASANSKQRPQANDHVKQAVIEVLAKHGDELGWMKVQLLGTRLSQGSPKIVRKDCGRAKWVDYFSDHPDLFQCKGKGADAQVRLHSQRPAGQSA